MSEIVDDNLYMQDSEIKILDILLKYIKLKSFFDIGAERGSFTQFLLKSGFEKGYVFEPLERHYLHLQNRFRKQNVKVYGLAIDCEDKLSTLNVACDDFGNEMDYFHSLNKIDNHPYFKHQKHVEIQCRSLESMLKNGEISSSCGVLKIDTEGNDLNVLKGIGVLRPEIIICEFVPPSVYPQWELSFACNLVPYVKKLGYDHYIMIQRTHGIDKEQVLLDPKIFGDADWGNIFFLNHDVYSRCIRDINKYLLKDIYNPVLRLFSRIRGLLNF
jgi:FkbM family methyltransferase